MGEFLDEYRVVAALVFFALISCQPEKWECRTFQDDADACFKCWETKREFIEWHCQCYAIGKSAAELCKCEQGEMINFVR